ncbi:MAG TPA: hemerythrin domain-containing protein [Actinomycetota bacterium]|nr:hemerythrin domain-containing protein [Actinomycetota bacterium]
MTIEEARVPTNAEVIDMIRGHHDALARRLDEKTDALLAAAEEGDASDERRELDAWYRNELIPHALAEEATLYLAGDALEPTSLLVQGMLDEHRAIVAAVDELAAAQTALSMALAAACARSLFSVHLVKENDLLLPALDAAGLDLTVLLEGMHDILGASQHPG